MSKKLLQQLSVQATAKKMCFEWDSTTTHISNILKTKDLRVDVHKDMNNPGWAIAHIQVNKEAKDPAAKELLRKGNSGAHKTTHKNVVSIHYSQTNYNNDAFKQAIEKAKQTDGGMITLQTEEPSGTSQETGSGSGYGSGYGNQGESSASREERKWEYDPDQRMQKYWDGAKWIYYDEAEKREKFWDGTVWQWNA